MAEIEYKVTVTDLDIPFWRIVTILTKWAIAAIPAMIIVSIVIAIAAALLSALFGFTWHELGRWHAMHY